jgi:hypothetical protein
VEVFLGGKYVGNPIQVWLGFLDEGGVPISTPIPVLRGMLSAPEIDDDGETVSFSVRAENESRSQNRSQMFRMSQARQQLRDPTDKGFEFMESIPDKEEKWVT